MRTWIQRLPRSNAPQAGESLSGYLLNLAYRLRLTPKELIVRTGLKPTDNPSLLDLQYTVALPAQAAANLSIATGLTETEVAALTIQGHQRHTVPGRAVARTNHSNLWLDLGHTRYCPQCLADTNHNTPDHAVWQLEWQTPWAIACTIHQRLLVHQCDRCSHPVGSAGPRAFRSAIANIHRPVTHPASCRARNPQRPSGLCDHQLDRGTGPDATAEILQLQAHLNDAMRDNPAPLTTLGTPVTASERLRDLRLAAILLQLDDVTSSGSTLIPPRVLTQPPPDPRTAATLLQRANDLLDQPTHSTDLRALARTALDEHTSTWKKAVATSGSSPSLLHALKDPKNGIADPRKISPYLTVAPSFEPRNVYAYLDPDTYDRHFDDIPTLYQRPIRRCVPIAIYRLVSGLDTRSAGRELGYDEAVTHSACARASDAFDPIGLNDFRRRVAAIVAENNARVMHTDYARLRAAFTPTWTIPDDIWSDFMHTLLSEKMARADTPWKRRRPAYATWVWGLITCGDLNSAPMICKAVNGRLSTNGIAKDIADLRRRTPPAHQRLVAEMAEQVKSSLTD